MNAMTIRNVGAAIRDNNGIPLGRLQQVIPSAFAVEAHASRSARYAFIPTAQVIEGMVKEGFVPVAAVQQRVRDVSRAEFTRHLIRFRHPTGLMSRVGDIIPEIILLNSHDGTSAYRIMAGLFRLVCTNGLVVGEGRVQDHTVRHSGDAVSQVIDGAFSVIEDTTHALDARNTFAQIALTEPERRAFGEAARNLRWEPEAAPVEPDQIVQPRRHADLGADLWTTFNVAQENLIRGGLPGITPTKRRTRTRTVTGVSENIRLNRALWTLTEEMAKLKRAA